jgi:hypothetical protein
MNGKKWGRLIFDDESRALVQDLGYWPGILDVAERWIDTTDRRISQDPGGQAITRQVQSSVSTQGGGRQTPADVPDDVLAAAAYAQGWIGERRTVVVIGEARASAVRTVLSQAVRVGDESIVTVSDVLAEVNRIGPDSVVRRGRTLSQRLRVLDAHGVDRPGLRSFTDSFLARTVAPENRPPDEPWREL